MPLFKSAQDKLNDELFTADIARIDNALKKGADANVSKSVRFETSEPTDNIFKLMRDKQYKTDKRSFTPLTHVIKFIKQEGCLMDTLRILQNYGADFNQLDNSGYLPLNDAIYHGRSLDVIKTMRDLNARLDIVDEELDAPLHAAAAKRFYTAIGFFIEHQKKVLRPEDFKRWINLKNSDGQNALHVLLLSFDNRDRSFVADFEFSESLKKVRELVEHGVDYKAEDKERRTPWHIASNLGLRRIKAYLSDPDQFDQEEKLQKVAKPDVQVVQSQEPQTVAFQVVQQTTKGYYTDPWNKRSDCEIVRHTEIKEADLRITEVFNFRAQTYVHITQNDQGAIHTIMKKFKEISDTGLVAEAEQAFLDRGGDQKFLHPAQTSLKLNTTQLKP